jgi:putative peptidoglycan lipid II flippase
MFGSLAFGGPVVQIMYERGAFGAAATTMTTQALMWYSLRICFAAVSGIIVYVFYTLHDTKTPVYCSCASVAVNVVLNLILVRVMAHSGLALATSVAAVVNAVLLWIAFRRKHSDIQLMESVSKLVKIVAFSAVSVAAAYGLWLLVRGVLPALIALVLAILAAVGVYLIVLKLAGFEEIALIKQLIRPSASE